MKTTQELIEEIVNELKVICKQADQYQLNAGYPVGTPATTILEHKLTILATEVENQIAKAFGGCKKCYGKGYGTQTLYARGHGESDMGEGNVVIDEKLPTMVFCSCDRGKQLQSLSTADHLRDSKTKEK